MPDFSGGGPAVITLSDVKSLIQTSLYFPELSFPSLAAVLTPLLSRNGSSYAAALQALRPVFPKGPEPADTLINPYDPLSETHPWALDYQPTIAIAGGDAQRHLTKAEFIQYHTDVKLESKYEGDAWATIWLGIYTWTGAPKFRFGDTNPIASNVTAEPILFANNILDPVMRVSWSGSLLSDSSKSAITCCAARSRTYPTMCRPLLVEVLRRLLCQYHDQSRTCHDLCSMHVPGVESFRSANDKNAARR